MIRSLRFEALWLLLALGVGGGFGWLAGSLALGLLCGLLPVVGWHGYQIQKLSRCLATHRRFAPPFGRGVWGQIHAALGEQQQRLRRHKRRQLRFAERLREAAVSVPDALAVLDKGLCLEWSNPAAGRLLGVHWPQDLGQPLAEAVPNRELGDYLALSDFSQPLALVLEHNRAVRLSLRITPFGAKKHQWLVVARDITKLYHLDAIRRDFLANASHELRTPLTVISGFLDTLGHSPETPPALQHPVALMLEQSARMEGIVEELLALSRMELGERPEHLEPVDVPALLDHLVREVGASGQGGQQIESEVDRDLLLLGNSGELREAFGNLIRNALQHTAPGDRIRVTWQSLPPGPTLSVRDSGRGIAPEHIPRLTECFYRVDQGRSRESGGTGLGLALVELVLSRHQGQLLIASVVGGGSAFTCRFPPTAAVSRTGERTQPPPQPEPPEAAATAVSQVSSG